MLQNVDFRTEFSMPKIVNFTMTTIMIVTKNVTQRPNLKVSTTYIFDHVILYYLKLYLLLIESNYLSMVHSITNTVCCNIISKIKRSLKTKTMCHKNYTNNFTTIIIHIQYRYFVTTNFVINSGNKVT